MKIAFDLAKDSANLAKHGLSLSDAVGFEWGTAVVWPDKRQDYGEPPHGGAGLYRLAHHGHGVC